MTRSTTPAASDEGDRPAPPTSAPHCPRCGGAMWDNRANKRNPRAPDFRCRDRACGGVVWPGRGGGVAPLVRPMTGPVHDPPRRTAETMAELRRSSASDVVDPREVDPCADPLHRAYLDGLEFALGPVRGRFAAAGVPCSDATVAAIAATLFISAQRRPGGG